MPASLPTLPHDQPVHAGSVDDVLRALRSDGVRGLISEDAAERLQRVGPNVLPAVGPLDPAHLRETRPAAPDLRHLRTASGAQMENRARMG